MSLDAPLVHRARELARVAHSDQQRKSGGPYFTHLEAVALLLDECGVRDERQLAAAYLHDLLEDRPTFEADLREQMPADVIAICELLTEQKLSREGSPRDKRLRFAEVVRRLEAGGPLAALAAPVSCADKIDNVRSLIASEREGQGLLLRLNTRPGEHRVQLASLAAVYADTVNEALLLRFDQARIALLDLLERWLPGRAVMIAAEAHLGAFDKAGAPYIDHPLRLRARANGDLEKMVAVLHDVVEDSAWTLEDLGREGFPELVLRALDHLTRRQGETYDAFIDRVAEDELATRIKRLDLEDNLDPTRVTEPQAADVARAERYRKALSRLSD
ncbi:MAG: HD domain-containing protein [Sandaracinaceae bacterium]